MEEAGDPADKPTGVQEKKVTIVFIVTPGKRAAAVATAVAVVVICSPTMSPRSPSVIFHRSWLSNNFHPQMLNLRSIKETDKNIPPVIITCLQPPDNHHWISKSTQSETWSHQGWKRRRIEWLLVPTRMAPPVPSSIDHPLQMNPSGVCQKKLFNGSFYYFYSFPTPEITSALASYMRRGAAGIRGKCSVGQGHKKGRFAFLLSLTLQTILSPLCGWVKNIQSFVCCNTGLLVHYCIPVSLLIWGWDWVQGGNPL